MLESDLARLFSHGLSAFQSIKAAKSKGQVAAALRGWRVTCPERGKVGRRGQGLGGSSFKSKGSPSSLAPSRRALSTWSPSMTHLRRCWARSSGEREVRTSPSSRCWSAFQRLMRWRASASGKSKVFTKREITSSHMASRSRPATHLIEVPPKGLVYSPGERDLGQLPCL